MPSVEEQQENKEEGEGELAAPEIISTWWEHDQEQDEVRFMRKPEPPRRLAPGLPNGARSLHEPSLLGHREQRHGFLQ
jgi:hypothetical protein